MRWLSAARGDRLALDDRGLAYGDGLFETIAVLDGKARMLDAHLDRLALGCRVLGIDTDPKRVALASSLGLQAWRRDQSEEWALSFTANRGFDIVIICADTASADPVELAGTIARDRGRVVATGAEK